MIDRTARDKFAEQLHQFVAGRRTNWEFEDAIPGSSDPAIQEIFMNGPWLLYDDLHEHRLEDKWKISKEDQRHIARWILFLKSEFEYQWPLLFGRSEWINGLLKLATLGLYSMWLRHRIKVAGDLSIWPFMRNEDMAVSVANPPYLAGTV